MTTLTSILVFAQGPASPVEFLLCLLFLVGIVAVGLIREASASYHLNIKGGLPYCPRCDRQVSYRRDVCRACGYTFKTYGGGGPAQAPAPPPGKGFAEKVDDLSDRIERWGQERAERREARDAYYRALGIKPGPLAWFRVLPDWQQAVFLGLAFAAPAVGLIVYLMR